MSVLTQLTQKLTERSDLSVEEAAAAAQDLAREDRALVEKADFLRALHQKGETAAEIRAFATVYRGLAVDPGLSDWAGRAIDIVGTGGSGSGGYNVSSVAALIVAAAGVPVLKHGNRAITSKSGSADFLPALGLPLQTDPALLRAMLEATGFCFFFAPAFHPAFKSIMPVRKALAEEKQATIFNVLGPLINPARPAYQLLGVARVHLVVPLAEAVSQLGLKRGLAVQSTLPSGTVMDEFSTAGLNTVAGIGAWADQRSRWTAADLGFEPCAEAELMGGETSLNLQLFQDILDGRGRPGLVDTLCLNAGAALHIAGAVPDLAAGCMRAREVLLGGALAAWLDRARAFCRSVA